METIIKIQEDLDNISLDFNGNIFITGGDLDKPIKLSKFYPNAYVILKDNAVINMYNDSYVNEMNDNSFVNSMYGNSYVNEMNDNSYVNSMYGNSYVNEMRDNSYVNWMYGNSCVNVMRNNSCVNEMRNNSCVNKMFDNSCVNIMNDNSYANVMGHSSCIKEMRYSSYVKEMWGDSCVKNMYDIAKATVYGKGVNINCLGKNIVFVSKEINDLSNIKINDSSQIIHDTFDTNQSVDFYLKNYNVKKKDDNTLIMYKAVHKSKVDGEYFSNYDKNFIYKIGQTKEHECSKDIYNLCSIGLHVSDLAFAKRFGRDWEDLSIIECEVPISDIVISKDCDGKVRTSKLTVIKEIN